MAAARDQAVQRFCRLDDDLEIVILESDRASWGIRGRSGDELDLTYRVEV